METNALNQVNQNSLIDGISSGESTASADIQIMFAKLQMDLAETNKQSAMGKIDAIKSNQALVKKIVDAVNELRTAIDGLQDTDNITSENVANLESIIELCESLGVPSPLSAQDLSDMKDLVQAKQWLEEAREMCKTGEYYNGEEGCIYKDNIPHLAEINAAIKKFNIDPKTVHGDVFGVNGGGWRVLNTHHFDDIISKMDNKLKNNVSMTVAQVKTMITNLEAKKDTIGTDVQQEMVLIQDAMGKYSAYTNGATAQISKYADTLTNIATGR